MYIRNKSPKVVAVAGFSIPPGRVGNIPDNHYQSWIRRAAANAQIASEMLEIVTEAEAHPQPRHVAPIPEAVDREAPLPPDPAEQRKARIAEAVARMGDGDFNKDGRPNRAKLKAFSGFDDVTDAERDEAWAKFQESVEAPADDPGEGEGDGGGGGGAADET